MVRVELTGAQAAALVAAADTYLNAGTDDECRAVFGSDAGTATASRAVRKLLDGGLRDHYRKELDRGRA